MCDCETFINIENELSILESKLEGWPEIESIDDEIKKEQLLKVWSKLSLEDLRKFE